VPKDLNRGSVFTPTGSPGATNRPRLPQNVACRFPALRSSTVDSQHSMALQLHIGQPELWML
jgi:hypothetical protein